MDTTSQSILVVEDDRSLSVAVSKKLELSDFQVYGATSVDEALQVLHDHKIDAIWLDHYLFGDKNGLDFVAATKATAAWQNIPIYIVSNTASDDKVRSYIKLGVTKYYVKSDHRLDEITDEIQTNLAPEIHGDRH